MTEDEEVESNEEEDAEEERDDIKIYSKAIDTTHKLQHNAEKCGDFKSEINFQFKNFQDACKGRK